MLTFLVRRLGWAAVSFIAVTLYTYVLFFVLPSSSFTNRRGFSGIQSTSLRESVTGGEGSFLRQYGTFVGNIVRLELGYSRRTREPVVVIGNTRRV